VLTRDIAQIGGIGLRANCFDPGAPPAAADQRDAGTACCRTEG
jgi:hypothetical protein